MAVFITLVVLISLGSVHCQMTASVSEIVTYIGDNFPRDLCYAQCPPNYVISLNTTNPARAVYGDVIIQRWRNASDSVEDNNEAFGEHISLPRGRIETRLEKVFKAIGTYNLVQSGSGSQLGLGGFQIKAMLKSNCNVSDMGLTADNFIYLKDSSVNCNVNISRISISFMNHKNRVTKEIFRDLGRKIKKEFWNFFHAKTTTEITCYITNIFKSNRLSDPDVLHSGYYTLSNMTLADLHSPIISVCDTLQFFMEINQ